MPGAFLASSAIRSCFVETVLEFDTSMVFPSNDSVLRQPLCSGGSLGSVPRHHRSYGLLRLPDAPPAALRSLAWRYRPVPAVRSRGSSAPSPRAGFVYRGFPTTCLMAEASGSPKFLGNPLPACPALRPRRTGWTKPYGPSHVAFRRFKGVGSAVSNFRGSITRPARLPVYASQSRSPFPTQDSVPAAGWAWPGGYCPRWVPMQGFRLAISSFPLAQALLGAMNRD